MPRIAFCGASGTGKTTLARRLAHHLNIPLGFWGNRLTARNMGFAKAQDTDIAVREVYSRKRAEGYDAETAAYAAIRARGQDDTRSNCRDLFQEMQRASKRVWEDNTLAFVTDRTYIDGHIYHEMAGGRPCVQETLCFTEEVYGAIIYLPLANGQWLDGDPVRQGIDHEAFDVRAQELLDRVYTGFTVVITPQPGSIDEVFNDIVTQLDAQGIRP